MSYANSLLRLVILSLFFITSCLEGVAHAQKGQLLQQSISKKLNIALSIGQPDSRGAIQILLTLPKGLETNPSVFFIDDPSRLVMDIPKLSLTIAKTYTPKQNPIIKAVRIGSHPDMVRLVFDLIPNSQTISKELSPADSGYMLTLSSTEVTSQQEPPTPMPTVSATSTPAPLILPTASVTATPVQAAVNTATPTSQAVPDLLVTVGPSEETIIRTIAAPTIAANPEQALSAITFDYQEAARIPVVRLSFSKRPQYKLSKVNESAYKLTVPKASLNAQALGLPQFPPQDFVGFTLIHATPRQGRLEVVIGVDRGIKISAVTMENDIIVRIEQP